MTHSQKGNYFLMAAAGLFLLTVTAHSRVANLYTPQYPHFSELHTKVTGLQDPAIILLGFRDLAADISWIQLVQYLGGASVMDADPGEDYKWIKYLTLRTVSIDPYFIRPIMFGATSLAWLNLINRPDEAITVIEKGLEYNPGNKPLVTIMAAIGYKQEDQTDKMIMTLEKLAPDPDTPTLAKVILANAYKRAKRYRDAIRIWEIILDDPAATNYHDRAEQQILEMGNVLMHRLGNQPASN